MLQNNPTCVSLVGILQPAVCLTHTLTWYVALCHFYHKVTLWIRTSVGCKCLRRAAGNLQRNEKKKKNPCAASAPRTVTFPAQQSERFLKYHVTVRANQPTSVSVTVKDQCVRLKRRLTNPQHWLSNLWAEQASLWAHGHRKIQPSAVNWCSFYWPVGPASLVAKRDMCVWRFTSIILFISLKFEIIWNHELHIIFNATCQLHLE